MSKEQISVLVSISITIVCCMHYDCQIRIYT